MGQCGGCVLSARLSEDLTGEEETVTTSIQAIILEPGIHNAQHA